MTLASPKGSPVMAAFPRSLSSIVVSVGGLALFLTFASWLLISSPIGSTVSGYLYDYSNKVYLPELNHTVVDVKADEVPSNSSSQVPIRSTGSPVVSETEKTMDQPALDYAVSSNLTKENEVDASSVSEPEKMMDQPAHDYAVSSNLTKDNEVDSSFVSETEKITDQPAHDYAVSSNLTKENDVDGSSVSSNVTMDVKIVDAPTSVLSNSSVSMVSESTDTTNVQASPDAKLGASPDLSSLLSNTTKTGSVDADCDLYHGNWFYDPAGPSYTNNTCPIVTQMQNCQGNGRPDKEYENWRWKPSQCDLPRFDGRKFLELMRGKTLAFIGDSVARNQMESLLCLLWQVEVPKNRGNRKMQRWQFKSTSTMIVRIWSSWLVHRTSEKFDYAPEGIDKLHLDVPDEYFMEHAPTFDVVVLSSGHWFAKQSVYIMKNEIVGTQLWSPPKGSQSPSMNVNNIEAFAISVDTALTAFVTHPNYTGLTIVRSFSPDHYEGGAWNTGGSCTGKVTPLGPGELIENGFTNIMHEKQVAGFERAMKKATNKSKLKLMDITEAFGYRHDGHPGPYRSPDPNKLTKRGQDGRPPPQDCLHWCMPGPVDTWNELVLEIMRREL